MRVLVTGATGFIGSHAVAACLRTGCEVGCLVLPGEAAGCRERLGGQVAVFAGRLDAPPWDRVAAWSPDACIHCAWLATPGEYLHSPRNLDFLRWSKGFLERLAAAGTRRLIAVGSCAERLVETLGEAAPLYARCKDELRQFVLDGIPGATCAWARLFYPYGIGEAGERLASSLIAAFAAGREFSLRCPDCRKDYVHVDDVALALVALVRSEVAGLVEIGTGAGVRLGDLAGIVAERMASHGLLRLGTDIDPLGDMVADAGRIRAIGWSPAVPLTAGLAAMVEHACREGRP